MKTTEKMNIQRLIEELLISQSVFKQEEIREWLENEHGISLSQPAISRYIDDMDIVKGKGGYKLNESTKRKKLYESFDHLLSEARAEYYHLHSPFTSLILKCQPGYAALIAEKAEELFSTESDPCIVFTNPSGYLMVMVTQEREAAVRKDLDKLFNI